MLIDEKIPLLKKNKYILILSVLYVFAVICVNPAGEFPLNDDWAYSRTVKSLFSPGGLEFCGWMSMTLISQVIWGAMFCLPLGFSFFALRLSTIVLGLVSIITVYNIIKETEVPDRVSFICALAVAFNPVFFELSNTFMTDIPFLSVTLLAYLYFIKYMKVQKRAYYIMAIVFSCISILIRQLGIAVPVSFLIAFFISADKNKRNMFYSVLPFIICAALLLGYEQLMKSHNELPVLYVQKKGELFNLLNPFNIKSTVISVFKKWSVALMYLGLFLLPVLLMFSPAAWKKLSLSEKKLSVFVLLFLFVVILCFLFIQRSLMPLGNGILLKQGLGGFGLTDVELMQLPNLQALPVYFWIIVTGLSIAGILLIFLNIFSIGAILIKDFRSGIGAFQIICRQKIAFMVLCGIVLYSIPMAVGFFDRFLFLFLPLSMVLLSNFLRTDNNSVRLSTIWGSIVVIVLFGCFSIAGTRDFFEMNRVKWKALNTLMETGKVRYNDIDGGFEFNGWYGYGNIYRQEGKKDWYIVGHKEYMLSYGMVPEYRIISKYNFSRWLILSESEILVLKSEK